MFARHYSTRRRRRHCRGPSCCGHKRDALDRRAAQLLNVGVERDECEADPNANQKPTDLFRHFLIRLHAKNIRSQISRLQARLRQLQRGDRVHYALTQSHVKVLSSIRKIDIRKIKWLAHDDGYLS